MYLNTLSKNLSRRKPATNSRLPQWGLTWLNRVQCFYQSLCLVDSEVLRNPPLRQAAKRLVDTASLNIFGSNE
ncbi:MAG: hypothetical protein FJX18_06920 [Alphaproteobacteria bacterium]|nr:hypothetical protein [Alphaproteobacteria bacterium]